MVENVLKMVILIGSRQSVVSLIGGRTATLQLRLVIGN